MAVSLGLPPSSFATSAFRAPLASHLLVPEALILLRFIADLRGPLAHRPLWLFSSGQENYRLVGLGPALQLWLSGRGQITSQSTSQRCQTVGKSPSSAGSEGSGRQCVWSL